MPSLAKSLAAVHEKRRALEAHIEALLEAHPLPKVLTSMPGIGVRTAGVLLATVGPSAAHLASYAGLAPATRQSGSSIHGEYAPRGGNRQLERAMFLSAFATLHDPASRTYNDRCRARGKPTPRPSSASPATAPASSSPCSATDPSTNPEPHGRLDERHRGTPAAPVAPAGKCSRPPPRPVRRGCRSGPGLRRGVVVGGWAAPCAGRRTTGASCPRQVSRTARRRPRTGRAGPRPWRRAGRSAGRSTREWRSARRRWRRRGCGIRGCRRRVPTQGRHSSAGC
ncbi:Insertion element IS110 uncharacterized 43.6 kDa protein [Streptomyces leeuwenhoekii]|uniref:Insertion element IS110 uncharacterized 43.6 kDa protein n=1 Tax=Streptomyces leeuwenhoekii TaxID=1437453 RepID=A0A0F7W9C8_STRLW|nr:Insertion element IS110 uncharacterized 43.6 kDa protein [Streptomyces leeuwenhoekii]